MIVRVYVLRENYLPLFQCITIFSLNSSFNNLYFHSVLIRILLSFLLQTNFLLKNIHLSVIYNKYLDGEYHIINLELI